MLTDNRRVQIVKFVEENGSASVSELMDLLDASESTIRRDLTQLDHMKLLHKVHGGALSLESPISTSDPSITERSDLNIENKLSIAKHAATLIRPDDIVFLDAGTTTYLMIDHIQHKNVIFVTNGIDHAKKLAQLGFSVHMPSGILKAETEALVGSETCHYLGKMNFTKGFFGTNGITPKHGFTTPDTQEADVKETAFLHCKEAYILADSSKFDSISAVRFAAFEEGIIIVDHNVKESYKKYKNVIIAES